MSEEQNKSASQHVSEVLGDLVTNLSEQMMVKMCEFNKAQQHIMEELSLIKCEMADMKAKMPTQPCSQHTALAEIVKKHLEEHEIYKAELKKEAEERTKFWRSVLVVVLGSIAIATIGALWVGIKSLLVVG